LGPRRYRGCCRDTATNTGSDSYTTNNSDSMRPDNANAYTDRASGDADTYGDSSSITYTDTYTNTNGEFTTHVTHANTHGDSSAQGNTKASPDSASSAVSA
jgi:hypothetical protein